MNAGVGPTVPRFDGTQACLGRNQDIFFPPGNSDTVAAVGYAKRICARCPLQQPCLDYAIAARVSGRHVAGVWGGTTEDERRAIRVRRTRRAVA